MNFLVLEALFANRSNYTIVDGSARREPAYAERAGAMAVRAFAQDVH
jgi:UDP-3-O-[3-hydroxymyristoyl] N-acetylglucosamine deacetylase